MWLNPIFAIVITYLINNTLVSGAEDVPDNRTMRIADRECEKIINSTIPSNISLNYAEEATLGDFPHMVALGYEQPSNKYVFYCGGSLISERFVLTAAHCAEIAKDIKPTITRMGVVETGGQEFNEQTDIRIAEIIKHPQSIWKHTYHDITLLRLEKPVQFTKDLKPVCLYTSTQDPIVPLRATGWGNLSAKWGLRSELLLQLTMTMVEKKKCSELLLGWGRDQEITDTEICTAKKYDWAKCRIGTGGALQGVTASDGQYRLIGITSFARGCGLSVPTVFMRISSYLDWIENIVWPQ